MLKKVSLILLVLVLVAAGLVLGGVLKLPAAHAYDCSKSQKADNAVVIRMEDNSFQPRELTVNICDTLLFLNLDDKSKWPQVMSYQAYPGFDAGRELKKYDYFTFQVTRPGTYSFQDRMNTKVTGKITIKDIK
ncbi:MAG: cupredoxin domain-containing protein [Candidatus Doudnabacteria bacterium]|nr:cupredoxin domain-containing protein [Candidatus Doudnabacteria bacterium]